MWFLGPIWASILLLGLPLGLLVGAGCKGDVRQCEQGCRNFGNLVEWKQSEAEIAAVPAEQRDALRKRRAAELDHKVDFCVSQCVSGNDQKSIDCLIAARTADQALACAK